MNELQARSLFTMTLSVLEPQVVGVVPLGYTRRIVPVSGGRFEGERLKGRVLPGGAAWAAMRADGVVHMDVRLTLSTEEGELVYATYTGRRAGAADVVARFRRGETVPEGADYLRIAAVFETAAPRLLWLNDIIAIGRGHRPPEGLRYEVFELL